MNRVIHKFKLGAAILTGFASVAAGFVSAGTFEDAIAKGSIVIGVADAPPWSEITADGEIVGGAPDVTIAVLKKLGINNVEAKIVEYGAMIPGLQANRFDVVAAGLFIKAQRCEAVLFSEPDVCDAQSFAVMAGNPMQLNSYEDVAKSGAKIAVCGGCVEEGFAREAGVPVANIITVPDRQSSLKLLADGRVDVYAYPYLSMVAEVKKIARDEIEIVTPIENTPVGCGGAAFRKADTEFRDAYNVALNDLKANGEFEEILGRYGFPLDAAMNTTTAELCSK